MSRHRTDRISRAAFPAVLVVLSLMGVPGAEAATFTFATPISGDVVEGTVSVEDVAPDVVQLTVAVPPGAGDILGLFGNVLDESLVSALAVIDPADIATQWQFAQNTVWKVGGGNTMAPVKTWDWGVKLGSTGSPGGVVVETASFQLTAPGLDAAQVVGASTQGWMLAVRIQSTNGPEGSSKLGLGAGMPPDGGEPPEITITSPSGGLLTGQTPVEVTGTVAGDEPLTVQVNGAEAVVNGGTWSVDVPLVEGQNPLVATATNDEGSDQDSISVTLDSQPPLVTITTPEDGSLTTDSTHAVVGSVVDASPIDTFTVNGQTVGLTSVMPTESAFDTTLPLALGANPIVAEATDAAGNTGSAGVTITRGTPPTVLIEIPEDGASTVLETFTVSGSASGSAPVSVDLNGVAASVDDGTWTAAVPLALGPNTITASATNPFGSASAAVTITRGEPPTVAITTPADGTLTTDETLTLTGSLSGTAPLELDVNGVPGTASDGSWTASVPLSLGANVLTATVANPFGTASASVTVTRGEAPDVTIASPADGSIVGSTPVTVTGTVSGTPPVALTVAGQPASLQNGSYSASIPLEEGENVIAVAATNDFGAASAAVTVTLELGPPLAVVIEAPPDGARVSSEVISVAGSVSDSTASVQVNGVAARVMDGRWTAAAVRLGEEGENLLTATAAREGETAMDTSTVVFNRPPEVVITSPPDAALLREPQVDVHGFVDDPTAFVDVNGVDAAVGSGGRFTAPDVPLDLGANRLTARAIDAFGATDRDRVDVTRDDAAAGRLRVVLVDSLQPFELGGGSGSTVEITGENLERFRESLERAGLPPQGFEGPVEDLASDFQLWVYVFSELGAPGESVRVEAQEFQVGFIGSLQPMADLEPDLEGRGFDPALAEEIVPRDFDPSSFESFKLELIDGAPE